MLVAVFIILSITGISVYIHRAQESWIISGGVYSISVDKKEKLLSVDNSSYAEEAKIVVWSDTQSDSQFWILERVDGGFLKVTNVASGLVLTADEEIESPVVQKRWEDSDNQKWKIDRLEDGSFVMSTKKDKELYITLSDKKAKNGTVVVMQNADRSSTMKVNIELQEEYEEYSLDQIADKAMENFLNKFYVVDENGGKLSGEHFWTRAETLEIVVDAYERTQDKKYLDLFDEMYRGFTDDFGTEWSGNIYNDDIMWMVIATVRAYQVSGNQEYLDQAKYHFDLVFERAWDEELGGGLYWRADNQTKNSCINCPAVIAASLLSKNLKDETYMEKAFRIYEWQRENLFEEATGAVYDAYDLKEGINKWTSTYNQGTFMGAATMLYEYTGDDKYLEDAKLAADYTVNIMFENEVMNSEESGNDLPGFKGILARWLRYYIDVSGDNDYNDWMIKNAKVAWNNRNSSGVTWTQWAQKTEDQFYTAWGCSAMVSMLQNCPSN